MRLFHKLFALLSVVAMVSALGVAGVLSWNLQRGFSAYLDARDGEMLDDFVTQLETELREQAGTDNHAGPVRIRGLVEGMARDGAIRELPPFAQTGSGPPPLRAGARLPGRPGERPSPPDAFGRRLRVFDAGGQLLFGPLMGPATLEAGALTRPVRLNGQQVATARVLPRGPTPRALDARFLRAQFVGVAVVTTLLLLLAAVAAWWLARAGVRRIAAVQDATTAIAGGELDTRVAVRGRDEIAAMGADINTMAESLERLEGARRRWLAEISHELRTPLTVLRGELDALRDGIRPMGERAVVSLSEEVERLNLLIDDLHLLAIADLGALPVNRTAADATKLVCSVGERFGAALQEAGLTLELACDPATAVPVLWDAGRMDQLMANLITNSIRYTDAPGRVRVGLDAVEGRAVLTVEDSAPGVPTDHLTELFEPLHRLEEARDRVSGGSGLGLSVARAIVRAHGGRIEAAPSDLGGLRIIITLALDGSGT